MVELVDTKDSRAVRNKDKVLGFYDLVINQKRSEEHVGQFMTASYVQHNPLIPDGAEALGRFFGQITRERVRARVVVHHIIAVGDYVWAHVNFVNLFNDDPHDTGIAGVDIYKMDAEGQAIEHWDCLQVVGAPNDAAPWLGPNVPRANSHSMF
jgi:predicted SnoaL-like aldol condensation-catalyzing enzyme